MATYLFGMGGNRTENEAVERLDKHWRERGFASRAAYLRYLVLHDLGLEVNLPTDASSGENER